MECLTGSKGVQQQSLGKIPCAYTVKFVVKPTGVADGFTIVVPAPESRGVSVTVGADQTGASGCILLQEQNNLRLIHTCRRQSRILAALKKLHWYEDILRQTEDKQINIQNSNHEKDVYVR